MGALLLLSLLAGAPQGLAVTLSPLELRGAAAPAEARRVVDALAAELKLQGYAVLTDGKGQALIVGRLEKSERGWVLALSLVDAARQIELDDVKLQVAREAELGAAGTEAAKRLASAIRLTWGVRARLKL
jgi:hypothetical protein